RPMENQSSEGKTSDRIESMTALAAEAAEDFPRAAITAAPLFCTRGRNSSSHHFLSLIVSRAGLLLILALTKSGTWVAEWLPQTTMLATSVTATLALAASIALARFWSRRIMAKNRSLGIFGAWRMA